MVTGIPPQQEIASILFNEDRCKEWLVETGIIWRLRGCETCGKAAVLNVSRESYRHNCLMGKREMSMWKNMFFSSSKLATNQTLNLAYLWLISANYTMLQATGSHTSGTITAFIQDIT
jgi:hypothetical protein